MIFTILVGYAFKQTQSIIRELERELEKTKQRETGLLDI
jgi:hypothetical protein